MSVESTVVFLGLSLEIPQSEVEALETRKHPLLAKARSASLQHFWANFGGVDPQYVFLIGKKVAIMGVENDAEHSATFSELESCMREVRQKLRACGFEDEPQLILQLLPST